MTEVNRAGCLCLAEWPENEEFRTLMAAAARHDEDASQRLSATVTPLFTAFYEGQLQAGRIKRQEISELIHEALVALHRCDAGYEPSVPSRAWLIAIARDTLLNKLHIQGADAENLADLCARGRQGSVATT